MAALCLLAALTPSVHAQVRGELRLEAPSVSSFVLHGTLPVRPGTFPRADGRMPFAVRDSNGALVETQVETVSRFAKSAWGADVVEVLARVRVPQGTAPGTPISYKVIEAPQAPSAFSFTSELKDFMLQPGSLVLLGTDALGHRYQLDLLAPLTSPGSAAGLDMRSNGSQAVRFRTHGSMRPVGAQIGAPSGALPHLFGVHSYVTLWRDSSAFSLDLRVHNGLAGLDKQSIQDDALSHVYFKDLTLLVRQGWRLQRDVQDPTQGTPYNYGGWVAYPLIEEIGDGSKHFMPRQAELHRRLALGPLGEDAQVASLVRQEGLGFAGRGNAPDGSELWSWWNEATSGFGPQRHKLPELDHVSDSQLDGELSAEYWKVRTAMETGSAPGFPILSPALGWAHPWGVSYGGATGGSEIYLYDGLLVAERGSRQGYLTAQMAARMYAERSPLQLWKLDGDPVQVADVLTQGPGFMFVPMNFYVTLLNGPDPFGFDKAPTFQIDAVQQAGLKPAYEPALAGYLPIDLQHYVRLTRNLKTLAWLGNDQLAKDELRHAAAIAHLSFHQYPVNSSGLEPSSGLLAMESFVGTYPGKGFNFGRGEAWSLDAMVTTYAFEDDAWRGKMQRYFERVADVVARGQIPCSGMIQASVVSGWLGGQWRARASAEHAIVENALWGLKERVFRASDPGRLAQTENVLEQAAYGMIGPLSWSAQNNAPWFYLAVAPLQLNQQPYCNGPPPGGADNGGDNYQSWSSFAYGWELSGDPVFLQKAAAMAGGGNLLLKLKAAGTDNLQNKAALLATLQ